MANAKPSHGQSFIIVALCMFAAALFCCGMGSCQPTAHNMRPVDTVEAPSYYQSDSITSAPIMQGYSKRK